MKKMEAFRALAPIVIDLSADFRLNSPDGYPKWYEHEHELPELLTEFVYGIPELHREEIRAVESHLERRLHGDHLDPRALSALPGGCGRPVQADGDRSQDRLVRLGRTPPIWRRIIPSAPA